MNIRLMLDYQAMSTELNVIFSLFDNTEIVTQVQHSLLSTNKVVDINFAPLHQEFTDLVLEISTDNFNITNNPLVIQQLICDDFFQIENLTYRGTHFFSEEFLDYAKQRQIYLDHTVTDSNKLDFTGKLVYSIKWPFFRELC